MADNKTNQSDRERMQNQGGVADKSSRDRSENEGMGGGRTPGAHNDKIVNQGGSSNRPISGGDVEREDLSSPKNTKWNPQADSGKDSGKDL